VVAAVAVGVIHQLGPAVFPQIAHCHQLYPLFRLKNNS